jgi:VWFA-related protein
MRTVSAMCLGAALALPLTHPHPKPGPPTRGVGAAGWSPLSLRERGLHIPSGRPGLPSLKVNPSPWERGRGVGPFANAQPQPSASVVPLSDYAPGRPGLPSLKVNPSPWERGRGVGPFAQAQAPARIDRADATDVTAIVVDVVVRDRRGNPVTNLTAADFELTEDGVRQEIGSFTPVLSAAPDAVVAPTNAAGSGASVAAPAAPAPAPTAQAPAIVALVFDRLSPEARAFAHKAAMQYVGDTQLSTNIVAVFGVDLSLVFYQPFTRDADKIRQGIQAAGGRGTSRVERARERAGAAEQGLSGPTQSGGASGIPGAAPSAAGSGAAAQGAPPGSNVQAQMMQIESRMVQRFAALEQDAQGFTTANALTAIVSAMRAIPGRKSLVFFSEGLSFSSNVQSRFFSVIDAANRANVSIYPMDAAGLRTLSTARETTEGLYSASRAVADGLDFGDSADRPRLEALETNEALLRADPHSGLGILADETGGMLIAGSNELKTGFTRIDTDLRNYYVLTYVPANTTLDGKYRRIGVKVRREGLRVYARKGYYAVRPTVGAPVLGHEAPALTALEQTPVPNAFPARAAAFRFPEAAHPGLLSVLVHVPTASVTFQPAKEVKGAKGAKDAKTGEVYTSDFVVLVRFRDQAGQVVEKMSQRYQIHVPLDQLTRATQGDVLFYRQPELTPGVYTMESVVHDALSTKATVRVSTIDVPDVDPAAPRLSSLMLVRGSEKLSDEDRKAVASTPSPPSAPAGSPVGSAQGERPLAHPLIVGDRILRPLLGEPLSKSSAKELTFYFVAYPAAGAGAGAGRSEATVELLSNAQPIATAPLQLDAPDTSGRIPHVSRLPLEALTPGTYELRVRLRQGASTALRTLQFRVVP